MNGSPSLETSILGNNFCNKSLDLGPAMAAPAHCSVVETTFTLSSGQTSCK